MGAVGLVLLSACNPISQTPQEHGDNWSTATLFYDGPADASIEVGVSGISGYQVTTQTAIHIPNVADQGKPRDCKSGTERTKTVPCGDYPEFPYAARRQADLDPAGSYWPTVLVHPGEEFQTYVTCSTGTTTVVCPAAVKVEARSVDDAGKLIGDLHGPK
jgi:hypothetical protein